MAFNDFGNRFQQNSPVVLNLVIINVLVYLVQMVAGGGEDEGTGISKLFALHYHRSEYFQPYQLITYMFMHGGFFHILFNMLALYMFGSTIERVWGPKRFLLFYMICGVFAGVVQLASYAYEFRGLGPASPAEDFMMATFSSTVGASGAIMGILAAFGYLFPNVEMIIFPIPIPIKAKWAISGMILLDVFGGVNRIEGDNVAHFAHIGGALIGFLLVLFWNKNNRRTFY